MTDNVATIAELQAMVRTVPDFPSPGIQFRDITTLIANPRGLHSAVSHLAEAADLTAPQMIAGMEARGFIFGAAVAAQLGIGFLPIRKPGKLPVKTISVDYALEYGSDRLEIDPGAVEQNMRVAIIDDLIATGGTALAATDLLRQAGADVVEALFVIDLPDLGGADRLREAHVPVRTLMAFDGD